MGPRDKLSYGQIVWGNNTFSVQKRCQKTWEFWSFFFRIWISYGHLFIHYLLKWHWKQFLALVKMLKILFMLLLLLDWLTVIPYYPDLQILGDSTHFTSTSILNWLWGKSRLELLNPPDYFSRSSLSGSNAVFQIYVYSISTLEPFTLRMQNNW